MVSVEFQEDFRTHLHIRSTMAFRDPVTIMAKLYELKILGISVKCHKAQYSQFNVVGTPMLSWDISILGDIALNSPPPFYGKGW